jgi:stage II sporulation protein AA (anti-sigma F factor antagonist)
MEERALQPDLSLTTKKSGGRAIVAVKGDLDAFSARSLEAEVAHLVAGKTSDVVFDLSGTFFLDSSGLRALLVAERSVLDHGGQITLRAPSEPVQRLLEITGLSEHFPVEAA